MLTWRQLRRQGLRAKMLRQHKSWKFNKPDWRQTSYTTSGRTMRGFWSKQTTELNSNMFIDTFAWGQLKFVLICCCLLAIGFIHILWARRKSVGKESTWAPNFILKSLTAFLRISSKIELSRLASGTAFACSTDAQINISNFSIFLFLSNRSTLAMTANNNTVRPRFISTPITDWCTARRRRESSNGKKLNHSAVWSLSNPSFFFRHRFFDERVDAWTVSKLMIAARCYTISYKKTFRLRVQIFISPTTTRARFGKRVKSCVCREILGEREFWLKASRSSNGPSTPRAEMVSLAGNAKFEETML